MSYSRISRDCHFLGKPNLSEIHNDLICHWPQIADFSNEILIELGQPEADEKGPSNYHYQTF